MSGPINIPNTAGVVTVNTSNAAKTLLLPLTASIYGKIITIKDISSNAANCNITIQTRYPPDLFEDGRSNYLLKNNFGSVTFLAKSNIWYTLNNSSGEANNGIIDTNNLTIARNLFVGTGNTIYNYIYALTYSSENNTIFTEFNNFTPIAASILINSVSYNPAIPITLALVDNSQIYSIRENDGSLSIKHIFYDISFNSIGFGNGTFYVANSNTIYSSTNNGVDWNIVLNNLGSPHTPNGDGTGTITSINYNSASNSFLYTIAGSSLSNNFYYINSCNIGTNSSNIFSYGTFDAFWNGSLWVAVGFDTGSKNIAYSSDGINWSYASNTTTLTNTFFTNDGARGIYFANSIWVAVGQNNDNNYNIYVSSDGSNFQERNLTGRSYNDITYSISEQLWYAATVNTNIDNKTFLDTFTNNGTSLTTYDSILADSIFQKLVIINNPIVVSQVHITPTTIEAANIYATNYYYTDGTPLSVGSGGGGSSSNLGVSSLSSIVAYGLSSVSGGYGLSSLSSIVAYGLSSINGGAGVSSLSSIVAYGLSSVYGGEGISSLSSIVAYGLSSVYGGHGLSSLSSIVAYGLSSVYGGEGISSLSSIVAYGLSSISGGQGISSLSSIVSYGLSSVNGGHGLSSLSSIVSYGLSSIQTGIELQVITSNLITSSIITSSFYANYISSAIIEFSTISTQTILVGYLTSPLQVDVGVETPYINTSNIQSYKGFFEGNVGIGRKAPYWYALDVSGDARISGSVIISSNVRISGDVRSSGKIIGDGSELSNLDIANFQLPPTLGVSSLSSIVAYGLSSLLDEVNIVRGGASNPGLSTLSSIVAYGLSSVYGGSGISSLSSIISYGLSTVYGGHGVSSLSSIVAYGLSSLLNEVNIVRSGASNPGLSTLSSIVSYGLSSINGGDGISSLSSIVSYGLSTISGGYGISSLSSIISYGLSTVYGGHGVSSLSSIVAYGLSSLLKEVEDLKSDIITPKNEGVSSLSSIVAYGLSTVYGGNGISSLSSIISYGLSTVYGGHGVSSLSSIVAYGLSSLLDEVNIVRGGASNIGLSTLSSIVAYGLSSLLDEVNIIRSGASNIGLSTLSSIVAYGLSSIQKGITQQIITSSFYTNYISSGVADFSTISTQTLLVGYVTSPLQVDVGVETPNIYASNIQSYKGFFEKNLGIGRKAPYWYALDVVGNTRFENIELIGNFKTSNINAINIESSNITASNITATYFYGDATNMTNVPSYGVSTLSSIVSYGLSSVYGGDGISSLSSIVAYGLSSVYGGEGISSLSSIISYGLSTFRTFLLTDNATVLSNLTFGSNDGAVANTQENLIIFKGPGAQNQVYIQTTGSFSVETGVTTGTLWNSNPTYGTPSLTVDSSRVINLNTQTTVKSNVLFYDSALNVHTSFCNQVGASGFYMNQNGVRGSNPVQTIQDGIGTSALVATTLGAIHIQQNSNAISPGVTGITFGGLGNTNPMAGILSVSASNSGADLHLMTSSGSEGLKDRLTITSNGFVGVNTSTPSVVLDVAGDTTVHGNVITNSATPVLLICENGGIQYYTNGQLYNTNLSGVKINEAYYNGSIWIAVAENGNVYYSSDTINWERTLTSTRIGAAQIIANTIIFGNNIWYIGGAYSGGSSEIDNFYSYDGQVWKQGVQSVPTITKVAYNSILNVYMITLKSTTSLQYFTDPRNSLTVINTGGFNIEGNYIYYNSNLRIWIALGRDNRFYNIQYSSDNDNFYSSVNNNSGNETFFTNGLNGALSVDYGNNRLIVVGDNGGLGSNMYYSTNGGRNFTVLQNNISNVTLGDIKYFSGSTWFATHCNNSLMYKSDDNGSNWISIPLANRPTRITVANVNPFTTRMSGNTSINKQPTTYALDINGSTNIGSNYGLIVGIAGTGTEAETAPIQLYQNNIIVPPKIFNYSIGSLTSISTNGYIWVAAGNNTFLYSYDGQTYYDGIYVALTVTTIIYLSYGSNIWLAVGSNNTTSGNTSRKVSYSYDGITWILNNSNFIYNFTGEPRYNGSYWLIPANGNRNRSNSLLYTTNPLGGSNSYLPAITGGFVVQANAVEWNGSLWVATGITNTDSNVQYSYNGRNWSNTNISFSSSGTSVAYGNNVWVVGGNDGIFNSINGISFTRSLTSTNPGIKDIKFIQNGPTGVFYGLSNDVLIISSNGLNWFNVTTLSGLTSSRLAVGFNTESLLTVNGTTTTNFLTVHGTTTTNALTVNGATTTNSLTVNGSTNLGSSTNASNLNITGNLTYNNEPVLLSVNNITNTNILNVSDSTTTNALNVTGRATFSNTTTTSNLNITGNLTYNNRRPHYFTYIKEHTDTNWNMPANGLYSNIIVNNRIPGITTTSNYIFTDWLLTIVGHNIRARTNEIASNISGVYAGLHTSNNWGYYIRGQPNIPLNNITLNFIAYPINFLFNSGETTIPLNQPT
jgi:hypothetical protein